MTKNEGYLYAKKLRRKHLTHVELESLMISEGYTESDIKLVKAWLGSDYTYLRKIK